MNLQMLDRVVQDQRAWRADTVSSWAFRLLDDLLAMLEGSIRKTRVPVTQLGLDESTLCACREAFRPVLDSLEFGLGFVIVDRLPVERYSLEEAQAAYWLTGHCLGQPFEQNIEGTLLYDVRDMGYDVAEGARFSVTNADSSFHTDAAFGRKVPDYVGLLCLQTAKSCGHSQLVSAYAVHNELLARHRDVIETLYQPFYFDRRGQFADGERSYSQYPILDWDGQELTARYLHYYIQVGHQRAEEPMTPDQQRSLDVLEDLLSREEFRVQFDLQPGQMLFTNNHWILHNRTAFEDHPDPQHRRHYVRLWLMR